MSMNVAGAPRRITPARITVASAVAIAGLTLTGMAVFAGLNADATNTTAQSIDSGTLSLTYADNGAGFTSVVGKLAPGDVVNRYVDLTNGGTLAGKSLTLTASAATSNKLTNDATNGLQVTVTECTGGTWDAATGVCSGTTSTPMSGAFSTLATAPLALVSNVGVNAVMHFQVSMQLPDQNETVTNGNLPAATIQGLTADITWTFDELQRTPTTTDA